MREVYTALRCPVLRGTVLAFYKHQIHMEILKCIQEKRILRTTVQIYNNNKLQKTHKSPSVLWSILTTMTTWPSLFCATACSAFVCVALLSPGGPQIQGPVGQRSLLCFLHSSSPKINEQRGEKANRKKIYPFLLMCLQTNQKQKSAFSPSWQIAISQCFHPLYPQRSDL